MSSEVNEITEHAKQLEIVLDGVDCLLSQTNCSEVDKQFAVQASDAAKKLYDEVEHYRSYYASMRLAYRRLQSEVFNEIQSAVDRFGEMAYCGKIHPDDPDPHGLHGLSVEHRRETILYRESLRLIGDD